MENQYSNQFREKVDYLPMSLKKHDPKEVASLIYESAPELFSLIFGFRAIENLTILVQETENRFSYQYIRVAQIQNQVVGIAVIIPAEKLESEADLKILSFRQKLRLTLVTRLILPFILQSDYPQGSFYLGNLAVNSQYRNQGIGRQLLLNCIDEVATISTSPTSIYISVDINNPRAQKLYESMGFQLVKKKVIGFGKFKIGSLVLALTTSTNP
ncbi:MAG: GNAT family N-acetyltransferase [Halothece sp.]